MAITKTASPQNTGGAKVAIIAMFFLFAMVAFVTNLAAPIGTIWGYQFEGNSFLGMLGNMMNFLAYLFMGIPAGKMLARIGYKKTALWAMAIGVVGLFVQWLSSVIGAESTVYESAVAVKDNIDGMEVTVQKTFGVTVSFIIYLIGAFICGFCVCMLNTVVNPMLNLLGGGGNRGNQLIQTGGALNSLAATLTPFFVGALIGQLTRYSQMSDVAILLWIAMGIFLCAFIIISFVKIPEPELAHGAKKKVRHSHSALSFRHTVLGIVAIFFYVGIEVGIPGTLNFYLSDQKATGAGVLGDASAIAGAVVALYWLLMLVGRTVSGAISGKVSTRAQLVSVTGVAIILLGAAIFISRENRIAVPKVIYDKEASITRQLSDAGMPAEGITDFIGNPSGDKVMAYTVPVTVKTTDGQVYTKYVIKDAQGNPSTRQPRDLVSMATSESGVPVSALLLVLAGLCTSVMWGNIFNLAVDGLGKYTAQASGLFMMMVVGGGIIPLLQQLIANSSGYMNSYWLLIGALGYIFLYAIWGCINVNKDIPVGIEDVTQEQLI